MLKSAESAESPGGANYTWKINLVQQKTLILFGSPQHDRWHTFSEVSVAVTSNHVDINSVWKLLETSCTS